MEIAHILEELAYDMGELPREAIEAAIAKKSQITPYLLQILEEAALSVEQLIEHDNYQGHLYAMYLLAQFRDPRAYPLIVRLISYPGEIPHALMGDVLTEDLSRILASICGGEVASLEALIENRSLNEYVRAAAITSLGILVGCGLRARHEVILYFRTLFAWRLEREPSFVWDGLIRACLDLYPEEMMPHISAAFRDQLVNSAYISLEDIESALCIPKERHLAQLFQSAELIEDTVSEMEKWLSSASMN